MKTADLSDQYPNLQYCEPLFDRFGAISRFGGPIRTVRCFEDNSKVRQILSQPGHGAVLVVDAGGSRRCAMVGDVLAQLGVHNGWGGIVLNGMIRDSAEIDTMPIGIHALGTFPLKSRKENTGQIDEPVRFAGVTFQVGHYLYADSDGMVVSETPLSI